MQEYESLRAPTPKFDGMPQLVSVVYLVFRAPKRLPFEQVKGMWTQRQCRHVVQPMEMRMLSLALE